MSQQSPEHTPKPSPSWSVSSTVPSQSLSTPSLQSSAVGPTSPSHHVFHWPEGAQIFVPAMHAPTPAVPSGPE